MKKRALISVSNKKGLTKFARRLIENGFELVSTGGTYRQLSGEKIPVKKVSEITGFPEIMDGRVKTLHPGIHGGILAQRKNESHLKALTEQNIDPIDLVVVNLYPFRETVAKRDCSLADAIENIDIGGPTMIRAAAKNHGDVAVVVSPDDYDRVADELTANGKLSDETRFSLALTAFRHTAEYDNAIANYLTAVSGPDSAADERALPELKIVQELRYGENPHQKAGFYLPQQESVPFDQVQGKELSFNNLIDIDGAVRVVADFEETAAVVIKHTNPCGAATSDQHLVDAFVKARATDPVSAFGGIIGLNREVDGETANEIGKAFVEVVVATDFTKEALEILGKKKNLRLIRFDFSRSIGAIDIKRSLNGYLIQEADELVFDITQAKVVTKRKPTPAEWSALKFGWRIVKHVKSNAIVYAGPDRTLGIGAGQMSRVDSSEIAVMKAEKSEISLAGSAIASDAFFPFRDGVDAAAAAGATAVVQPGGSIRDEEVIQAADEHNMTMIFTGVRHFRH